MTALALLAFRSLCYRKVQSALIVTCLGLVFAVPVITRGLITRFEDRSQSRARTAPLVIGASGGRFDLVLHALYFRTRVDRPITMREVHRVQRSDYAQVIPLHAGFRSLGEPVVGTTRDYFTTHDLKLAAGREHVRPGECVIGASVARRHGITPGSHLVTEAADDFALDGVFPLRMLVTGILAPTSTPDDDAIFTSLETTWIVAGFGHGHEPSSARRTETEVNRSETTPRFDDTPLHDAQLTGYTEVTNENLASFHFHGSPESLPLTAMIVIPHDERSAALLEGRYLSPDETAIIVRPADVLGELQQYVLKLAAILDAVSILLMSIAGALVGLLTALSIRLRASEIRTLHQIGCSRFLVWKLIAAETVLLCGGAACVTAATVFCSLWMIDSESVLRSLESIRPARPGA